MTPCIEEAARLLRIAKHDLQAFEILAAHPAAPFAAMCFHAQQCTEKSLKAVLTAHCTDFPYTHNLVELARLVTERDIPVPLPDNELQRLNVFAVEARYDDEVIRLLTQEDARRIANTAWEWAQRRIADSSS